jgi:ribose transport system substrate-binding protein
MTRTATRRRYRILPSALLALTLVAAACGSDDTGGAESGADAEGTDGPLEIAHFVAIQANPVEEVIITTAQATADAEDGVNVTLFDASNDPQNQIAQCQDAITTGKYDGFLLKAVAGETMIGCAEEAVEAGITVVAQGNALGPDPASTEIQVEGVSGSVIHSAVTNGEGMYQLLELACAETGETPCEVIYLFGPLAFDWASRGRDTVQALVDENPDITIVAEQTHEFNPDLAIQAAEQLIPANPGVDVLLSDSSNSAAAVVELGITDDILVVGSGTDAASVAQIRDGRQFGQVLLIPATEARLSMQMLIDTLRGRPVENNEINVAVDGTPFTDGSIIATTENIGDFEAEWPLSS